MHTGQQVLEQLWSQLAEPFDLRMNAVGQLILPDDATLLPSSFHVSQLAQASIGMASLAAAELGQLRGGPAQQITVSKQDAERECSAYFTLDGTTPDAWEKFSGLYATSDGYVRIHANFAHHRDGALALLGLDEHAERADVQEALLAWSSAQIEEAAADAGLVVACIRSFAEWDKLEHARINQHQPAVTLTRIGDAPALALPELSSDARPLDGINVTELTRILAGPICGRTLAAYGARVMLVNGPHLPNIANITDTSRGKRSCHIDLRTDQGKKTLNELVRDSHVFVQGYRPQALGGYGYTPAQLAELKPGIIVTSLSAYGSEGPWRNRRGFDSLVQSACGFNHAEAHAAGSDKPRTLPLPILDYASGFLMAFGTAAALRMQQQHGGSWHVQVSLLHTANWLRNLGRIENAFLNPPDRPRLQAHLQPFPCTHGELMAMPHAAHFSHTPATFLSPSALPGQHPPHW